MKFSFKITAALLAAVLGISLIISLPSQAQVANALAAVVGLTTDDRCTTTDTTACTIVGSLKQVVYLLGTATGPASAANSNSFIQAWPTLVKGTTAAMTGTTSTSVISAVASNYLYVTNCTASNNDADTSTLVNLQDGDGGSTIYTIPVPYGVTNGMGGVVVSFPVPIQVPTIGNALYAVNGTTGSSVILSCSGFASTIDYTP